MREVEDTNGELVPKTGINTAIQQGQVYLKDVIALLQTAQEKHPNATVRINRNMISILPAEGGITFLRDQFGE